MCFFLGWWTANLGKATGCFSTIPQNSKPFEDCLFLCYSLVCSYGDFHELFTLFYYNRSKICHWDQKIGPYVKTILFIVKLQMWSKTLPNTSEKLQGFSLEEVTWTSSKSSSHILSSHWSYKGKLYCYFKCFPPMIFHIPYPWSLYSNDKDPRKKWKSSRSQ